VKVEISPGKLYGVGGSIPLDGRVSWAPPDATGFQPTLCYVLVSREIPLIVDPGLASVEEGVMDGLKSLIPEGAPVEIFLTRSHADSTGNLGAITETFQVKSVYTTPMLDPLSALDHLGDPAEVPELRAPDDAPLEVIHTSLRLLATYWGYDAETKTMFTSDSFTHVVRTKQDVRPLVDSVELDGSTVEDARGHMWATLSWLPGAVTTPIAESLTRLFDTHEVDTIAPARGCVLQGRGVVDRHLEMVMSVLTPVVREVP
jgi:flavorubredoxin